MLTNLQKFPAISNSKSGERFVITATISEKLFLDNTAEVLYIYLENSRSSTYKYC
jgi:hypothetical protein